MNSEAERQILGPLLERHQLKVMFIDEPSLLRPQGPKFNADRASESLISSAEQWVEHSPYPVSVIGLSFGALIAEHLAAKFPDKVKNAVLISPTPDLASVFLRMMKLAEADFRELKSPLEEQIRKARFAVDSFYDAPCREGMSLTGQDPLFYGHYWTNKAAMAVWGATLGLAPFAYDSLSQDTIYQEMSIRDPFLKAKSSKVPMTLVLGEHDPVLDEPRIQSIYQDKFTSRTTEYFAESAHFPHLEEPEKFLKLLSQLNPAV